MPKRISIIPHLTIDELEQRYRQSTETIERSHYQIIWLLSPSVANKGGCISSKWNFAL
jgi:hypothetical protein